MNANTVTKQQKFWVQLCAFFVDFVMFSLCLCSLQMLWL